MSSQWTTGLAACTSDTSGCCDALLCAPCQMGRQCNATDNMVNTGNCGICIGAMLGGFPIMNILLRLKVKGKYDIDENSVVSCCCAFLPLLGCLSFCQTHRELTARNSWPGGACCQSKPMEIMQ